MKKENDGLFLNETALGAAQKLYNQLRPHIDPLLYGGDIVRQLAGRLIDANLYGRQFCITGFICPFYEDSNPKSLSFTGGSKSIGLGSLEDFPYFQHKFDRLLHFAEQFDRLLGEQLGVKLDIIMGDKGIVNGKLICESGVDLPTILAANVAAYQKYLINLGLSLQRTRIKFSLASDLVAHFPEIGRSLSDVVEDGKRLCAPQILNQRIYELQMNEKVFDMVINQATELQKKEGGEAIYEPFGFALNYGVLGLGLRQKGVDVVIGTDPPGVYLNFLYHSFMEPNDLIVMVPKE